MAIDVECLGWPEHEDGEKVGTADEGDDEGKAEDARIALESLGEHGVLGEFRLPNEEGDNEDSTKDQGDEHMG